MCGGGQYFLHLSLPVTAAVVGERDTVCLVSPKNSLLPSLEGQDLVGTWRRVAEGCLFSPVWGLLLC